MENIWVKDENGHEHIVCAGNPETGEIIYEPGKRDMLRMFLRENQPVTLRRDKRLTILRWSGKQFTATTRVA